MSHTFFLKGVNSRKESLIYFRCYFKKEEKRFFYSTGEFIKAKDWNYKLKQPKGTSKDVASQLNRYTEEFNTIESICKKTREDFTSKVLKSAFDQEFKRAPTTKNLFFDVFKEFIDIQTKTESWSVATVKRYNNVKNLLERFEKKRGFKMTFTTIDDKFYAEYRDYCLNELNHIDNTFRRNLGFLKSFMKWAFKKYTYNDKFLKFKAPKEVIVTHEVFELKDLELIMGHIFESKSRERVRDLFVFQCVTGLRYGEMKFINESNIFKEYILLKEEKDSSKTGREIPLTDVSKFILKKYNNKLPLLANQKHNDIIKDVIKEVGYTHKVQLVVVRGKRTIRTEVPFYDRITTHTARRSFITVMKRKGMASKLIGEITGQTSKTVNMYYQVKPDETKEAVKKVFDFDFSPKLKKA